jgi:hypothetical protein
MVARLLPTFELLVVVPFESSDHESAEGTAVIFVGLEEETDSSQATVRPAMLALYMGPPWMVVANDWVRKSQPIFLFVEHSLEITYVSLTAACPIREMRESLCNF